MNTEKPDDREQWIAVPGYEGKYEVSDLGRVKSVWHITIDRRGRRQSYKERILRQCVNNHGYLQVGLCGSDGKGKTVVVHKLVLTAFRGPRPQGLMARHLNGNQQDNRLTNLVYGTNSENQLDRTRHGNSHNARKTHCPRGHEYAGENLRVGKNGGRWCRTCDRDAARKSALKAKGQGGMNTKPAAAAITLALLAVAEAVAR